MFKAQTYLNRRNRLQKDLDSGLILIMGNVESCMNYEDNIYHFRQDSNFLYFAGIDKPGLAIIIDIDEDQTTLFGDDLTIDHIVWMGPQPSMRELADLSGIDQVAPSNALGDVLENARQKGRQVHYLPPYRPENKIKMSSWLGIPIANLKEKASVSLIKAVVAQASYKSAEEIIEMEKAVNITGAMHVAAMMAAKPGIKEAHLAGIVEGIAVSNEGHLAYPVIMTINGQTLHNHYHGNELTEGRLVLGDFGAETSMHYAGDITRTFPVSKTFTSRQKDIYNLVLQTEIDAIDALRPGVPYRDIHLGAAAQITDGLKSLGIMKGNTEDAVAQGAHALFFPHGLGHMIGLDVHDMEDLGEDYVGYTDTLRRSEQFGLRSLRLARALEPGFVLTVEPGIYFIPELIQKWKSEGFAADFINYDALTAYLDFGGVRIEDNVLITEDGFRVLGDPIPKTVDEVERVRRG